MATSTTSGESSKNLKAKSSGVTSAAIHPESSSSVSTPSGGSSSTPALAPLEEQRFLIECMKENLAHARHVENERLTFISLLLVSMGMILSFSVDIGIFSIKISLGVVLLLLNLLCTVLLRRWSAVFHGHSETAKKIMRELESAYSAGRRPCIPPVGKLGAENSLYYFNNRLGKDILKQEKKMSRQAYSDYMAGKKWPPYRIYKIRESLKSKRAPYFKTKTLFYFFNVLAYGMLAAFFVYCFLAR